MSSRDAVAPAVRAPGLAEQAGVEHGFLTRRGGVSQGLFASLNCGFRQGEDAAAVVENRARARAAAAPGAGTLCIARQVHGADVAVVTPDLAAGWAERAAAGAAPQVDGLVTRTAGVALGITTADCAPVLFADAEAGVVGAAHAGWRGALAGVVEATVAAMARLGARPARIAAAVGPTIAQPSYEVGPELVAAFVAADPANISFFVPSARAGHHRFDLPGFVRAGLARAGVGRIDDVALDTCADAERFFSYRRATLNGEASYGLGLSIVALRPAP